MKENAKKNFPDTVVVMIFKTQTKKSLDFNENLQWVDFP